MQLTRVELVDELLDFVGESGDTTARTIAQRLVNAALEAVWLVRPWRSFLMPQLYQLALSAGVATYLLPYYFGRIGSKDSRVRNNTTGALLHPFAGEDLYDFYPGAGTSVDTQEAEPEAYLIAGKAGVNLQPTGAQALEAVSDSADDIDVLVTLEGLDSTGNMNGGSFTLNGTNPVAIAGTWSYVQDFSKAIPSTDTAPAVAVPAYCSSRGNVSLRLASDHTVLQTLQARESAREQEQFTVWPKPDRAYTLLIPIIRKPRRLIYDSDPIPEHWERAIFEEMLINWRANTGELSDPAAAPRPQLARLVAFDNEQRTGGRTHRTRPFSL